MPDALRKANIDILCLRTLFDLHTPCILHAYRLGIKRNHHRAIGVASFLSVVRTAAFITLRRAHDVFARGESGDPIDSPGICFEHLLIVIQETRCRSGGAKFSILNLIEFDLGACNRLVSFRHDAARNHTATAGAYLGFHWTATINRYFAKTILKLTQRNSQIQRTACRDFIEQTYDVGCLHQEKIPAGTYVVDIEFAVSVSD